MVLVTGATGFLGSELVKQLSVTGSKIKACKRINSIIPEFMTDITNVTWCNIDLLDTENLEDLLHEVQQVYHCAALVSFSANDKKELFKTNIEGTANLVNVCVEKNIRLLHVSSIAALGLAKNNEEITEKHFWEFDAQAQAYSLSKYYGEMEVWRGIAEGLNGIIVNPSIIIGKNAGIKGSGALFEMVRKHLLFYTKGSTGFVDVEDVAACMIRLMKSDIQEQRYIINAENLSYQNFFTLIAAALKVNAPKYLAKPWMLSLAWRIATIYGRMTGNTTQLSKETARSSQKVNIYSNEKIVQTLNYNFKPLQQSIDEICEALKK